MRLKAILRLRCPRCAEGRIFRGFLTCHETCPSCGLRFEREPGYYVGALYMSYGLAVLASAPMGLAGLLLGWEVSRTLDLCLVDLAILSPWIFRYSRVLWIHFDRWVDPEART